MTYFNTLPNELLRKIFGFILPIFDFARYVRNTKGYNETRLDMLILCQECQDMIHDGDIYQKMENMDHIGAYTALQMEYLGEVKSFLVKNKRFERPGKSCDLTEWQYLRAFDTEVQEFSMERMEKNIWLNRGLWEHPDTKQEIMVQHDIPEILLNGTTRDLIYSCMINNIRGFKTAFKNFLKKNPKMSRRNDNAVICFINEKYSDINSCHGSQSFRRSLARSLMKI